jgi:hypothetical protein
LTHPLAGIKIPASTATAAIHIMQTLARNVNTQALNNAGQISTLKSLLTPLKESQILDVKTSKAPPLPHETGKFV